MSLEACNTYDSSLLAGAKSGVESGGAADGGGLNGAGGSVQGGTNSTGGSSATSGDGGHDTQAGGAMTGGTSSGGDAGAGGAGSSGMSGGQSGGASGHAGAGGASQGGASQGGATGGNTGGTSGASAGSGTGGSAGSGAGGSAGSGAGGSTGGGAGGSAGGGAIVELSGTATADSEQASPDHPAAHGNDGVTTTRWCAADSSAGHYWTLDLGAVHALSRVEVTWEYPSQASGLTYGYVVSVSNDGTTFTTSIDRSANTDTAQTQSSDFPASTSGRHVRITVSRLPASSLPSWASFFEARVYGR